MLNIMKNILIIVDVQKDFYDPKGALYVSQGETILPKISRIIPNFDDIIFTLDWHPIDHCSFKSEGGQWPTHCVGYSEGASVPSEFLEKINEVVITNPLFYRKGMSSSVEEYGAFGELAEGNEAFIKGYLNDIRINRKNANVVICGIAGDYCVLETLKNLVKLVTNRRVSVFLEGVVSIDGGVKLQNFIKENNIKIYQDGN